tara:strand:- start:310 stop:867 length:558 start_codon:yes stop_codon:yes gene_type:complete
MSTKKTFSTETSERYSRALFEVVKEAAELEKVESDVQNFLLLLNSSQETKIFLQNPTHNIENQNNVINLLSNKLEFTKNLKNFLYLLVKKRRIFFVEKIFKNFIRICSEKRGELKASLISSKDLSKTELDEIINDFSKIMGSNLKIDYKVDKELIGGLKLQLGSIMIDTTIKNKLKKYEQAMLDN